MCAKNTFSGQAVGLKEYSIAIDALGRAPGFDPQEDAIVRVDLHLLRKRLESYYAHDGKDRPVRIVLPLGQYAPAFVPNEGHVKTESCSSLEGMLSTSDLVGHTALSQPSVESLAAIVEESEKRILNIFKSSRLRQAKTWAQRRVVVLAAITCGLVGLAFGGRPSATAPLQQSLSAGVLTTSSPQSSPSFL